VWVPRYKAAFVGDNLYDSFPNIYTLRGTQPRWALDYVAALNKVLELKPEIVLPSHGLPIMGSEKIVRRVTQYRDAIQYVHDATVAGMNAGKDVYSLMREVKLPPELDLGETYGKVAWSVRGIYEGYVGWFDRNPATMYSYSPAVRIPWPRNRARCSSPAMPFVRCGWPMQRSSVTATIRPRSKPSWRHSQSCNARRATDWNPAG
jgi:alkyl sulfatase BDS1-like metallo-beta-lactamase superfamily hydrolase